MAPSVGLVGGVVPEAVVLRVPAGKRSFERQNGPVGLRHRPGRFPDRWDEFERVGALDLDRCERDVDAGRDESRVVGQELNDLRGCRPLGRRHAPARLEQGFAEREGKILDPKVVDWRSKIVQVD